MITRLSTASSTDRCSSARVRHYRGATATCPSAQADFSRHCCVGGRRRVIFDLVSAYTRPPKSEGAAAQGDESDSDSVLNRPARIPQGRARRSNRNAPVESRGERVCASSLVAMRFERRDGVPMSEQIAATARAEVPRITIGPGQIDAR